jgi:hypothetical protein
LGKNYPENRSNGEFVGMGSAAKLAGLSSHRLLNLTLKGLIPHMRTAPDGRVVWSRAELRKWRESQQGALAT